MRRLIPYVIIGSMTLASLLVAMLSTHQPAVTYGVGLENCARNSQHEPATVILFCADGNALVGDLHWSDWGSSRATATGVAQWNTCVPSCTSGVWKNARVTIHVFRIERGLYTRITGTNDTLFAKGPLTLPS